ncbi:MAG: hypothetical protein ACYCYO_04210, partial [Bacilli bacterium]
MKRTRSLQTALAILLLSGLTSPAAFAQSLSTVSPLRGSVHAAPSAPLPLHLPFRHVLKSAPTAATMHKGRNQSTRFAQPNPLSVRKAPRPLETVGANRAVHTKSFRPAPTAAGVAAPTYHAHFSAESGTGPLVTFTSGKARISFTLLGARKVAANLSLAGAVYAGIVPGADLSYQLNPGGLKEDIMLHRSDVATSFSFLVNTAHVFVRDDA